MRHLIVGLFAVSSWAAMIGMPLAATIVDTGKAVGVAPSAVAQGNGGSRTLIVGADVALGEKVTTGRTGQVQLIFTDDTHLVVGPNSALVIESYLLRKDQSVGKFTVSALAGTFRFITGKSAKDAYEIKTPTGTIGVRGTAFDLTVIRNVASYLMLFNGKVKACNFAGECADITAKCEIGAIDTTQAVVIGTEADRQKLLELFPYAHFQSILDGKFRVSGANKCVVDEHIVVEDNDYDVKSDPPKRTTTPGTSDPGTPGPGAPDPGTPDPGTPDPGTPDPGPTPGVDPSPTDPSVSPDPDPTTTPPIPPSRSP
jgi:hypothetical protein